MEDTKRIALHPAAGHTLSFWPCSPGMQSPVLVRRLKKPAGPVCSRNMRGQYAERARSPPPTYQARALTGS